MHAQANGRLAIGAFSRASLLSIKALRLYHEAGILEPAQTDAKTGYRFYSVGQLADAAIIRRLRSLEVSLDDIRNVLAARDPEVTRSVLARHSFAMTERLLATERIVADLQRGLAEPGSHTPARLVDLPEQRVVSYTGVVQRADYAGFLDATFALLLGAVGSNAVEPLGSGALYPTQIDDDEREEVTAYLTVSENSVFANLPMDVVDATLPAVSAAVLTYTGSYDDMGAAYRSLGAWVADHATMSGERVRELYLVSPPLHSDPDTYVTELHWPIVPVSPST